MQLTWRLELRMAMTAAMKKVLSPISDTSIMPQDLRKPAPKPPASMLLIVIQLPAAHSCQVWQSLSRRPANWPRCYCLIGQNDSGISLKRSSTSLACEATTVSLRCRGCNIRLGVVKQCERERQEQDASLCTNKTQSTNEVQNRSTTPRATAAFL